MNKQVWVKNEVDDPPKIAGRYTEFPAYAASKAGVTGYMRNVAIRLANTYRATCNALCFGGVTTDLNRYVMEDAEKWARIMDVTPLKRWATAEEAAEWCYFMGWRPSKNCGSLYRNLRKPAGYIF